eukprot:TRINITY_DN12419_c0_g1_i1.p1 TRINITY_DN12419_c0_g1~~TRINITY_DN12419_c0_g1_i1.p1  ORF type:complete len:396 (+),score=77.88 TRINITY_DN12419_c0_g1_i1:63-1250(+)
MPQRRTLKEWAAYAVSSRPVGVFIKSTDTAKAQPKQKHINTLVDFSRHPDCDANELASKMLDRFHDETLPYHVKMKVLAVANALINNADGRLKLCMATEQTKFFDGQGSPFQQSYARYIDARLNLYRQLTIDPCDNKDNHQQWRTKGQSVSDVDASVFENFTSVMETLVACRGAVAEQHDLIYQYITKLLLRDLRLLISAIVPMFADIAGVFFEQPKHKAVQFFELYTRYADACKQADTFLSDCAMAGLVDSSDGTATLSEAPVKLLPLMKHHVDHYYDRVSRRKSSASRRSSKFQPDAEVFESEADPGIKLEQFENQAEDYRPLPRKVETKVPAPTPGTVAAASGPEPPAPMRTVVGAAAADEQNMPLEAPASAGFDFAAGGGWEEEDDVQMES